MHVFGALHLAKHCSACRYRFVTSEWKFGVRSHFYELVPHGTCNWCCFL